MRGPRALAVEVAKSPAGRRRHVAAFGPAAAERQPVDQPGAAAHRLQHAHADPRPQRVERRALRDPRPQREPDPLGPRAQPALERVLAQLALQVGQRDLHRAHDAALVAQRRRRRQVLRLLEADVHRRQDRADRPRVDPAVRVPADVLVDGAMVHARAAADAAQRLAHVAAEDAGAPAVDDDEVHVLGAVELARALRAGQHVDVVGDRLARSPSAAAGASASRRPPASARSSRCRRSRRAPWAASSSASRCPRW